MSPLHRNAVRNWFNVGIDVVGRQQQPDRTETPVSRLDVFRHCFVL
jgi:hypothetical protein